MSLRGSRDRRYLVERAGQVEIGIESDRAGDGSDATTTEGADRISQLERRLAEARQRLNRKTPSAEDPAKFEERAEDPESELAEIRWKRRLTTMEVTFSRRPVSLTNATATFVLGAAGAVVALVEALSAARG